MLGLEQITADDAAGGNIGVDADETCPLVLCLHMGGGEDAPDGGGGVVEVRLLKPCCFLRRVIVGHGEGHQLIEVHRVGTVEVEQARANGGELEPLAAPSPGWCRNARRSPPAPCPHRPSP